MTGLPLKRIHFFLVFFIIFIQWLPILASVQLSSREPAQNTAKLHLPSQGILEGVQNKEDGYNAFYGVPFAEPPLGDLRWRLPREKRAWAGTLDVTRPDVKPCVQSTYDSSGNVVGIVGSEDCLRLNVWSPITSERMLPVMLWIHGGSYANGGINAKELYHGEKLLLRSNLTVVVVTIQYRLNVLGFLGSYELKHRTKDGSTGNFGIQDQRCAMRWVQRYISEFNGDPDRVFVFGQSAGAASVSVHLVMESSWRFFQSAGLESGSFSYWEAQRMHDAQEQYEMLKVATACLDMDCLVKMPAKDLVKAALSLPPTGRHCPFAPTVDGVELKELPWKLLSEQRFRPNTPILQGFNHDEGTIDVSSLQIHPMISKLEAVAFFRLYGLSGNERKMLFKLYQNTSIQVAGTSPYYWYIINYFTDFSFACPDIRTATSITKDRGSKVYLYEFDHTPSFKPPYWAGWPNVNGSAGVFHAAEIPFVFNLKSLRSRLFNVTFTDVESSLSDAISLAWIRFAHHQQPDVTESWPPFGQNEAMVSLTTVKPYIHKHSFAESARKVRCKFIETLRLSKTSTRGYTVEKARVEAASQMYA